MSKFINIVNASPRLYLGEPEKNFIELDKIIKSNKDANLIVFPELSITGYSCQDLFMQDALIESALEALNNLRNSVSSQLVIVGCPIPYNNKLYNCAVALYKGQIIAIIPKTHIPNYGEFYEKRWFSSSTSIPTNTEIELLYTLIPFGTDIIISDKSSNFKLGIEICEDLWSVNPPSNTLALCGANVIANLSASNELIGKDKYRRELVKQQSSRLICTYIYSNAGMFESGSDTIFSGHSITSTNGIILGETNKFEVETQILKSTINLEDNKHERMINSSFENLNSNNIRSIQVNLGLTTTKTYLDFNLTPDIIIEPSPFINQNNISSVCNDIFNLQIAALTRRLTQLKNSKVIIGVSGGLDSTLTLLVAHATMVKLKRPVTDIIGVTMPGLGTTANTKNNAVDLMNELGITQYTIDIKDSSYQNFKDIGHDISIYDITYENVQARQRTQILYNLGNKLGAINLTSSDLSEIFLGWCTYNADHSGHFHINSGIPKTLIKELINYLSNNTYNSVEPILKSILNTTISPELLPPDIEGNIAQSTEDSVGPYELHDFILYYVLRKGFSPSTIFLYLIKVWNHKYSKKELLKWLRNAYIRFFNNQFKRNFSPDGLKVGSVSLSPRTDWRMPSDINVTTWLKELDSLQKYV